MESIGFGSVWLKSISFGLFVQFAFERFRFGWYNNLSSFECFCKFDLDGAKLRRGILDVLKTDVGLGAKRLWYYCGCETILWPLGTQKLCYFWCRENILCSLGTQKMWYFWCHENRLWPQSHQSASSLLPQLSNSMHRRIISNTHNKIRHLKTFVLCFSSKEILNWSFEMCQKWIRVGFISG